MIAPDSISYPTLAVIQRFNMTNDEDRRHIWSFADDMMRAIRQGVGRAELPIARNWRAFVDRHGMDRAMVVYDHLADNLCRAHSWCAAQPKP